MWHPVPGCQPLKPEIQVTSDHCQGRVKAPAKERKERCWSPSQVGTRRETSDRRGCTKATEELQVDSAKGPEGGTWEYRTY